MTAEAAPSISAHDAIVRLKEGSVWLLDVREPYEWAIGRIPGSHHIPVGELALRQGELPDDVTIAVLCHLGYRSRMVADALVGADYDALDLTGGIVEWQSAGGPIVTDDADAAHPSTSAVGGPGDESRVQSR